MSHFASENDRVMNLLADAASMGLDARSADELAMLLGDSAGADLESMELAAAALDLALQGEAGVEAMPARVMASVAAEAGRFVGSAAGAAGAASELNPERKRAGSSSSSASSSLTLSRRDNDGVIGTPRVTVRTGTGATGVGGIAYLGWLAAAASVALAASVWLPRLGSNAGGTSGGTSGGGGGNVASGLSTLSFDQLKSRPGTIEIAWKPLPDETCQEKCSGEVIWNNELQQGYMTFKGLAANDPAKFQYQLWVFDAAQKHPVDGGVFDIAAGGVGAVAKVNARGEVVVPVVAKIRVDSPQAFAVTVEKPGGVVVSDQKRIATLAPVTKG